ncbi:MAG TPA: DUF2530 domain-containing protein [Trebonia sp.]
MSEAEASGDHSASESQQVTPGDGQRPARPAPPPPREADDRLVAGVITACWAVALVVLAITRDALPPGSRWWVWTCVAGFGMGLFGLWYVPMLKRRRARAAGYGTSGTHSSEPDSEYESRDSASKTVSSTETPGNSTRS